ncbi:MAG: hypothetical protein R3C20_00970 [Planctomycetaceae bacterium]
MPARIGFMSTYAMEELPVYERLGDVREKAVMESKIADQLPGQGNHDEAESIYRNSVIPEAHTIRRMMNREVF